MKGLVVIASGCVVVLVLVLSLIGTFHDDAFFSFAYARNGAYERTDSEMAWLVTENFQSFIDGDEELVFFQDDQASHLEDVKGLYEIGVGTSRVLVGLLAILFVVFAYQEKRKELLASALRGAAGTLFVVIGVIALLSLRWEWFFTMFHEVFFTGNWSFHPATLMIRMWGGAFFPLAAMYVLLKNVLVGGFLLGLSKVISRLSMSR